MAKRRYKTSQQAHAKLQKQLKKRLAAIFVVGAFSVVTLMFAPKVGYLFSLLSKYRNYQGEDPYLKPNKPIFSNIPKAAKETKVDLEGFAQSGMTVKLFVNGPEKAKTIADNEGIFTFSDVKLISGRNTVFAKAVDSYGNESDKSDIHIIQVDKNEPKIKIETPKNGATIKNLDKRILIAGKVDEEAYIKINERVVVQKPDLSFEYLLGVNEGDVEINIEVIDEAGNKTEEKLFVKYREESN